MKKIGFLIYFEKNEILLYRFKILCIRNVPFSNIYSTTSWAYYGSVVVVIFSLLRCNVFSQYLMFYQTFGNFNIKILGKEHRFRLILRILVLQVSKQKAQCTVISNQHQAVITVIFELQILFVLHHCDNSFNYLLIIIYNSILTCHGFYFHL